MANSEPMEELGIDPVELSDEDLMRELRSLHRTRLDTLRHGPEAALDHHLRRTAELESEYLARHPGREVDPHRMRAVQEADNGRVGPWDTGLPS